MTTRKPALTPRRQRGRTRRRRASRSQLLRSRNAFVFALVACAAASRSARADIPPLDTHADDVTIDAKEHDLDLKGHVTVDSPPFHLSSDELVLRRTPRGVDVDGKGRLAFCPCLGTPLTLGFSGAIVAPPGDLILRKPTLDIYGVPVFWAPYFWLRSSARVGLLPPDITYRGRDGVFLGDGVHVPWRFSDWRNGLNLRVGAYTTGGSAYSGELITDSSTTSVTWDHKDGDGVGVDARGAMETKSGERLATSTTWDVDVLRGGRGVVATTDVDAAARVVDRASGDAAFRDEGWTVASGVRSASFRGGPFSNFGATGPVVSIRRADAIRSAGDYDVTLSGGAIREEDTVTTFSYARGEAGALLATHAGAIGTSMSARAAGDVADDGFARGVDGAAEGRAGVTLPLVRGFDSGDPGDPWRHRIEPHVGVAGLASRGDDLLGAELGRGLASARGDAYLAETGISSAIGRWGAADAIEGGGSVAAIGGTNPAVAARWRAAAGTRFLGIGAEGAHLLASGYAGSAFAGRVRAGAVDSIHLGVSAAAREGIDPIAARLLTDAPLEPSAGFFATEGWTGTSTLFVPWTTWLSTRGGADVDLTNQLLVAARGGIELRDKCQCLAVRLSGAHRIGREGVDVWLTIDLAPAVRR